MNLRFAFCIIPERYRTSEWTWAPGLGVNGRRPRLIFARRLSDMILTFCPNPSVDKFIRLDRLERGGVNRSLTEEAWPGGKGVHVALALKELGNETLLAGFWGGPTGDWVRQECRNRGVQSIGPELNGWTRTCLTILEKEDPGNTEILELGPPLSENEMETMFEMLEKSLVGTKALAVSGSWPEGAPDDVYHRLRNLADQTGIPLWVDASGERLRQAIDVRPYGIHVNRSEVESIFGPVDDLADAARRMLEFCSVAAVTDGANGLYLATDYDKSWHALCHVEEIISTVGSGDCLLAGVISSHLAGESSREMAITGTSCGTANCIWPELGMIRKSDVERLKPTVKFTEIN